MAATKVFVSEAAVCSILSKYLEKNVVEYFLSGASKIIQRTVIFQDAFVSLPFGLSVYFSTRILKGAK